MADYFWLWAGCFITLGLALLSLHVAYRLLGSDFGLGGWKAELATALTVAGMQAGVLLVALRITQAGGGQYAAMRFAMLFSAAFIWICYKLTHLVDMGEMELTILTLSQHVVLLILFLTVWSAVH